MTMWRMLAVLGLAASPVWAVEPAGSLRDVSVDGLRNVLEAFAGRVHRFIHISSTSVYGQCDGEWIDESSTTSPLRTNGQVCLEAELLVWQEFHPASASSSSSS